MYSLLMIRYIYIQVKGGYKWQPLNHVMPLVNLRKEEKVVHDLYIKYYNLR